MHGNRLLSFIHARLRNDCSDLKRDLFLNICLIMIYAHVMFLKLQTIILSIIQFTATNVTITSRHLNCNILLFGNSSLKYSENITIVNAVY